MASGRSRFELVSRRAFLERSAALGLAAGALGLLAACGGNDDAAVFSGAGTTGAGTTGAAGAGTTGAPAAATAATTGTPSTGAPSTGAPTTAAAVPPGDPLPAGAELQVAFTFAAAASGRPAKNPYIAVWIEDGSGRMVQTVSLWLQEGKGQKWWSDLTRWYRQDQSRVAAGGVPTADTITGATRTAGDYTVSWDGTDYTGTRVAQGAYHLCIEAAREHGPYELIREPVTLAAAGFEQALTPKGELTRATVTYVV